MVREFRRLIIKCFHVNKVQFGAKTNLTDGILTIRSDAVQTSSFSEYIEEVKVQIIQPYEHNVEVNTIVDIIPISTKVLGKLGDGITHTLTGVYVMLTGADSTGRQMNEFGSSEGILQEKLKFGKAGSPRESDYIIHVDVMLKSDISFNRNVAFSMFQACDMIIQSIREILKMKNGNDSDERHEFIDKEAGNKAKIAIVKQVAGQGAMYDNLLFPDEPSGTEGGISIIDMNNMPVILTPNEYRDGALRALT